MSTARNQFVLVAHNNLLYVIGGEDHDIVLSFVETFSIANNKWEMTTALNDVVCGHAGAVCEGRIYVSGGQEIEDDSINNMLSYDDATKLWRDEPPMLIARTSHEMVELSGRFNYVLGGRGNTWLEEEEV